MQIALRELQMKDAPRIRAALSSGEVQRFLMRVPYPYPEGAEYEFIEGGGAGKIRRAVVNAHDEFLGVISAFQSLHPETAPMEIGYWLAPDVWGRGIGKRMVSLFLEELDESEISHLCAGAMKHNLASIKILQSVGFEYVQDYEIKSLALATPAPAVLLERKTA